MRRILIILVLSHSLLDGHGFGGNTYVKVPPSPRRSSIELEQRPGGYWARIEDVVECSDIQSVTSYHCEHQQCSTNKILARARSATNCYLDISFDEGGFSSDIVCSPFQQFYLPEKNCWVPANGLQVGDVLLTEREGNLPITHIKFFECPLDLYALKIACPHTFFVGRHSVLTHNMNLPVASLCWELPLTISTISTVGGLFTGFATAASGVAVGAIAASLIYTAIMEHKAKKYHKVEIPKDNMLLFAQKQSNTPKSPQGGNNNSNQQSDQSQKPDNNKPRCTDKVENMHELFNRKGFGEDLKKFSRKTREIDPHTRSQVYEVTKDMPQYGLKIGDKLYLDKVHKDHLEVFRGKKPLGVWNLDGSLNYGKSYAAAKRSYDAR